MSVIIMGDGLVRLVLMLDRYSGQLAALCDLLEGGLLST